MWNLESQGREEIDKHHDGKLCFSLNQCLVRGSEIWSDGKTEGKAREHLTVERTKQLQVMGMVRTVGAGEERALRMEFMMGKNLRHRSQIPVDSLASFLQKTSTICMVNSLLLGSHNLLH